MKIKSRCTSCKGLGSIKYERKLPLKTGQRRAWHAVCRYCKGKGYKTWSKEISVIEFADKHYLTKVLHLLDKRIFALPERDKVDSHTELLAALLSLWKWQHNTSRSYDGNRVWRFGHGGNTCALCKVYLHTNNTCENCPLFKASGESFQPINKHQCVKAWRVIDSGGHDRTKILEQLEAAVSLAASAVKEKEFHQTYNKFKKKFYKGVQDDLRNNVG
ncbi:hypothetical protein LCGC14_0146170 [marine sediment metagenome]|uniref:Uncharacterized protein n=1 Tax=marine sediment metagenome TaxID=412755 RepID=A0A0F9XHH4_9ZZZZ